MRTPRLLLRLLIAASLLPLATVTSAGTHVESVRVTGASLEVIMTDGEIRTGRNLAGAVNVVR